MAHARIAPHAPRSTRRGGGRWGGHRPPTHRDPRRCPTLASPHTHRRLSNQPQRRLVSRQAAVRLVCACWRGHDTRSVCIAPVLSRCTAPHRVYCSPSGALLSGRAAPCRTLLPIGCSSVRVLCPPSGALPPPSGTLPPHRALCPPHRALCPLPGSPLPIGCAAHHRARSPLSVLCPPSGALPLVGALPPSGSPLPIRCTTPVHPAETTSRGSGDRARHTPWLA